MTERIIIAGAGGQGIMVLGKVIAEAAMKEGKYTTWLPSYGAEVRGGTAHCMVVISDDPIGSPYVDQADTLIAMNGPSLERFKPRLKKGGLLMVNRSLLSSVQREACLGEGYPLSEEAMALGNMRVANMIALGVYMVRKNLLHESTIYQVVEAIAPPDKKRLIRINKQALKRGIHLERKGIV